MRATGAAARRRRAATPRPRERVRRRRALALLAAVALASLGGRGMAGAFEAGAFEAGAFEAGGLADEESVALAPAVERPDRDRARPDYVVVAEGDTLWTLVGPHAPPGTDPAVYVARVAAGAGLDPRALAPGTVIRLP